METSFSPRPCEDIEVDSILSAYPDRKGIIGGGSFGVVFATIGRGNSRLAVKIVHCHRRWKKELPRLVKEVRPMVMSARNAWKNVTRANRAFVHEMLHDDLLETLITTT